MELLENAGKIAQQCQEAYKGKTDRGLFFSGIRVAIRRSSRAVEEDHKTMEIQKLGELVDKFKTLQTLNFGDKGKKLKPEVSKILSSLESLKGEVRKVKGGGGGA